jgi:metallo-beta-lactamase class B
VIWANKLNFFSAGASGLVILASLIFLAPSASLFGQADEMSRAWNKPLAPFRIVGNLYYVGATEVSSFLVTPPRGHFLIDGGFVETAPQIERNIATLGFKLSDIKFLLVSHAHYDHVGGIAELKQKSGAKMVATPPDVSCSRAEATAIFTSAIN